MPSRNVVKQYAPESYYHIYNRGVNKQDIFKSDYDYKVFLNYLKRHLSKEPQTDKYGRQHPHFYSEIELLAFCLMPNHFHLLVYQAQNDKAISKFLQSLSTGYSMYFNKTHNRLGGLFQGTFRASRITRDEYLQHISRYIHLNPKKYTSYSWSSLPHYLGNRNTEWVRPKRILELFKNSDDYLMYVKDYDDYKKSLGEIKYELANSV